MQHVIYSASMAQEDCVTLNATYVNQLHESNNDSIGEGNIA